MTDLLRSIIRTAVPALVGAVVAWLAQRGLNVDDTTAQLATGWLSGVAYYAVARYVEQAAKNPAWGWLLGVPGAPTYTGAAISYGDAGDTGY